MSVHRESNYADGGLDGLADASVGNGLGHCGVQGGNYHHDDHSDPVFHLLRSVPIANPRFRVKTLEVARFIRAHIPWDMQAHSPLPPLLIFWIRHLPGSPTILLRALPNNHANWDVIELL